jgi:serine phosphatase RsbU (regulator of sigma subunit)
MPTAKIRLQEVVTCVKNMGDAFRDPMVILNADLRLISANRAFYRAFRLTPEETENHQFTALCGGQWNIPELITLLNETVIKRDEFDGFEMGADFPEIGPTTMLINGRKLFCQGGHTTLLVLTIEDITARKALETKLSVAQDKDRKIARALQRPMLFQPKEDAFSGLLVQTAYEMASEEALVGGDFWDTFAYDHGHVAMVIGDVMGHGLTSAIFTTELKHTMRAYIREHEQPSLILYHMNQFLYQSNRLYTEGINTEGSDAPVCLALAVIERETGRGTLAIAGMEPPLLIRTNGDMEQSEAVGMPLGVTANEVYKQVDFALEAGDTLVMTTDGITEARQARQFLDAEGLVRLALEGNGKPLKEMADTILSGARAFAGGKLKDDDALLLVRRADTSPVLGERPPGP